MIDTRPWDLQQLSTAPAHYPAPGFREDGVKAVFYESLPYRGKPTRVFAWIGIPEGAEDVPGMVLVHGGGGTAFAEWVRLWNARGYAAIAMDTCGGVPVDAEGKWERHPDSGPAGWGGFEQIDEPVEDHWSYHAVADVLLAHSLLRSLPGVNAEQTGITGISWGAYLTCIASGIDPRLRCAVPVYGCGFLGEDSCWLPIFAEMGAERAARWLSLWDPSVYLPHAALPMLWVTGVNDEPYAIVSQQKSSRLPSGPRTLCTRVDMTHGHNEGGLNGGVAEIHAFADQMLRGDAPLASVTGQGMTGRDAWATYSSVIPVIKAELNYTCDKGAWRERRWMTEDAYLDTVHDSAHATVPAGATAWYINLVDARELVVSSELTVA